MFVNTLELLNHEKWDLVSSRYRSWEFSAKYFAEFPILELIKYSWRHDAVAKTTCALD